MLSGFLSIFPQTNPEVDHEDLVHVLVLMDC